MPAAGGDKFAIINSDDTNSDPDNPTEELIVISSSDSGDVHPVAMVCKVILLLQYLK